MSRRGEEPGSGGGGGQLKNCCKLHEGMLLLILGFSLFVVTLVTLVKVNDLKQNSQRVFTGLCITGALTMVLAAHRIRVSYHRHRNRPNNSHRSMQFASKRSSNGSAESGGGGLVIKVAPTRHHQIRFSEPENKYKATPPPPRPSSGQWEMTPRPSAFRLSSLPARIPEISSQCTTPT